MWREKQQTSTLSEMQVVFSSRNLPLPGEKNLHVHNFVFQYYSFYLTYSLVWRHQVSERCHFIGYDGCGCFKLARSLREDSVAAALTTGEAATSSTVEGAKESTDDSRHVDPNNLQ